MKRFLILPIALAAASSVSPGKSESPARPVIPNIRAALLEMHLRQVELLKVDWGTPVLCTKWSLGYDPKTHTCGQRGKLFRRSFVDPHDPRI
jgi:hypothetical protein